MEFSSGGGGGGGSSGGDPGDGSDSHRRKKRYHRHTAHQIQRLESMFKECPHPDEKTRNQLSRELNLHPRQIKFWFQNRRTQMKAQHERADNCALRAENDKIRVSSIAAKYIGRPISQLPPVQPIHVSSLDLSMASFGGHGIPGPSLDLDLDLLPGSSSSVIPNLAFPPMSISDMDKSLMADIAANAMDELIRLLQSNEPLWIKSADGRETLNLESYERMFQSPNSHLKNPNIRIEASRDSGVVIMNGLALVEMFMDANKWVELFPTIVSRARTMEVISSGVLGNQSGTLLLMYEELQVLSALVPTRQLYFLRFCQQIEQGSWAIVDVSYDIPHQESQFSSSCKAYRLPSGCLIQDMPNGYSKVTWMEHWEVEDKAPIHRLYRDLVHSGLAFGAERWLSTLQRILIPSPEGKRSMMKLAERMVNNFCSSINPSNGQQWTTLSVLNEFEVRATLHKSTDPGQPNGVVLSAAATIWLPIPPQIVFNFFKDERTRPQWDVLSNQNPVQEVAHIANGSHPGNCISVLRAFNTSQNNMLILQESCIDSSGSLVVYCPVDLPAINIAMSGEDPSYIPLLPSGFTISPDGRPDRNQAGGVTGGDGASTSSNTGIGGNSSGSLITVVFQILVSNLPSARMSPESVTTVNNLIGNTVHQIKAALNCSTS
ncbi:Homeobox-leucine zipper protein HDG11 [Sesamum angolense]|uniref:Homeobox-leucine zipper protein HDG11 n=1 Tax=Sesamum angolense TaxID=2727404 RepID=A0AAE2BYI4_9LAMI|nr:Homeobox-leucine zipper protein HDG11 [Sesamum angolense]